jgi:hypothetical protein
MSLMSADPQAEVHFDSMQGIIMIPCYHSEKVGSFKRRKKNWCEAGFEFYCRMFPKGHAVKAKVVP